MMIDKKRKNEGDFSSHDHKMSIVHNEYYYKV